MGAIHDFRELIEGLSALTAQHVRLARLELAEDARFVGARVGLIAALAPLILVGHGFLCVSLALFLRRILPADLSFLLVGGANLLVGIVGIARIAKQLRGRRVLEASVDELATTSHALIRGER